MPISARQKELIDTHAPEWMRPYMYRMAAKEGASGGTSSTGAAGLFQFTRGTGRAYGLMGKGGDIRGDDEANTKAMVRLTLDNQSTLRKHLGRDPSFSELAVAHQQGGDTAGRMLTGTGNAPKKNLAVNNVDPNAGPQEAARQVMNYYGFDKKPIIPGTAMTGMTPGLAAVDNPQAFSAGPPGAVPYAGAFSPPGLSLASTPVEAATAAPAQPASFVDRFVGKGDAADKKSPIGQAFEGADQLTKGVRNAPSPEFAAAAAKVDPSSIGQSMGAQQAAISPAAQGILTQMIQNIQRRRGM